MVFPIAFTDAYNLVVSKSNYIRRLECITSYVISTHKTGTYSELKVLLMSDPGKKKKGT